MERVNWPQKRDLLISVICIGMIIFYAWVLLLGLFVHAVASLLLSDRGFLAHSRSISCWHMACRGS